MTTGNHDASSTSANASASTNERDARHHEAAPSPKAFRRDVQGLRALAVLAVILYHAGLPIHGGFVGVDVFFVISGFVITAMLEREFLRAGKISFLRFYQRRFKRLTPALAILVITTMVASILLLTPFGEQQIAAKTGIGAMLFVANLVIAKGTGGYFDPAASTNPLLHTWSLSVEEQFYFVFPLLFAVGYRLGRRYLLAILSCVTLVSFVAATWMSTTWPLGFYSPVTRAWEFALGAFVALMGYRASRTVREAAGLLGLVALVIGFFTLDGGRWPGAWTLVPALATALCIFAGAQLQEPSKATRFLSSRPLETVGNYSYSLYLWHWPFISLLSNAFSGWWVGPLAAALSVAPAILSYRFVEERFRTRAIHGAPHWISAVAAAMVIPMIFAAGLAAGQKKHWGNATIASITTRIGTHPGWDDCLRLDTGGTGVRQINPSKCTFGSPGHGPSIYLVGDSNAAMYSDPALETARRMGGQLTVRTAAGCPMADAYRTTNGQMTASDRACRSFVEETLKELSKAPRGSIVYVAEAPSQWLLSNRGYSLTASNTSSPFDARRRVLADGLTKTVSTLHREGLRPVLIEPMVTFPDNETRNSVVNCRTTLSILAGSCPSSTPLQQADPHNALLRDDVKNLAHSQGVPFVAIARRQCPEGACVPDIDGAPVIMDNGHFSAAFTTTLTADFQVAAKAAA